MKSTIPKGLSFAIIRTLLLPFAIGFFNSCEFTHGAEVAYRKPSLIAKAIAEKGISAAISGRNPSTTSDILGRPQIPILCYHQIRDWKATDSKLSKDYIVPVAAFRNQMKMLAESGYHSISPDQLYDYLLYNAPLPAKPVMLTFDDTDLPQFTVAKPEMDKYGFKGTFFIMTVSLGRPHYMNKEQVKELAAQGHTIGSHTWDHKNIKKYLKADWGTQIEKPTRQLEAITGKPIKYFAYPFGLWNTQAIPILRQHGFVAAFQLCTKRDAQEPLFTIRRIIVPGSWTIKTLQQSMRRSF